MRDTVTLGLKGDDSLFYLSIYCQSNLGVSNWLQMKFFIKFSNKQESQLAELTHKRKENTTLNCETSNILLS